MKIIPFPDQDYSAEPEEEITPAEAVDFHIPESTIHLAAIIAAAGTIPGCTTEIRGIETDAPVVWMYGITKEHKRAALSIGAVWSPKKQAWWVTIERFRKKVPASDEDFCLGDPGESGFYEP